MHHSSVSWEISLPYFFSWNLHDLDKRSPSNCKISDFRLKRKISQNLYFDRLTKLHIILAKKYRRVISHKPESRCKIWRKTDMLFQKWQEFSEIWPEHSQVSKISTFLCSYYAKYLMFDLKEYRGVIFYDTEGWCKILRKTDKLFGKWH